MGSFFSGGVEQPTAPSYQSAFKEGLEALFKSMSQIYEADQAYSKLLNAISQKDQSDSLNAYNQDIWNLQLQSLENSKQYASALLNYQNLYGNKYLDQALANLKAADPQFWESYEAQGAQILSDFQKGAELSDAQRRSVQQATRAGQAMRGNSYGYAPATQEVLGEFLAGENLKAQRQNAAQNFLAASPYNGFNIGAITAYQPQIYTAGYGTLTPYAYSNALSAGAGGASYAAGNYGVQNAWQMNLYNQPSPFISMLSGGINGATSGAMTGAMMGGPFGAIVGGVVGGVGGGVMGALS